MRNPKRIDEFCTELAQLWHKVPDWRLSQLMTNAMHQWAWSNKGDPFYAEDADFMKFLRDFIDEATNTENN